jgi:elongator complex protein 3
MDFSKINLEDNQDLARLIIKAASKEKFKKRADFEKFRNKLIKANKGVIFHNLYFIKAYRDLLAEGEIKENSQLVGFIQKRSVRTMSGVAPVTVLTKPYPCPGRCVYCPTDARMPKSYLPSQPAAQRAYRQRFNPYTQVFVRLRALQMTGHEISKVELRIIGGTWSSYPKTYQKWFVKRCMQAMNEFLEQMEDKRTLDMVNLIKKKDGLNTVHIKSLAAGNLRFSEVEKENETAKIRCIGVNIETRPDFIDKKEVKRLRSLGVTKVEMGVQTVYEDVNELTGRGHNLDDVKNATRLLKDAGFKISYHIMPNLPGSTVARDKKIMHELFTNSDYQPDYLKIYPCVVMPKTKLSKWYREGKFKPYSDKVLEDVLLKEMKDIPYWCRVDRIARDIPANEIEGGFLVSNIRQILEKRLIDEGFKVKDIRSREIQGGEIDPSKVKLIRREYEASGGQEIFLSYEDSRKDKLVALLRLRLCDRAFVREVHVYGKQTAVGEHGKGRSQHQGWGAKLLKEAEKIASKAGFNEIAVISGIGTREYYKKWGYELKGTYMVKLLNS